MSGDLAGETNVRAQFEAHLKQSLAEGVFLRLVLGKPKRVAGSAAPLHVRVDPVAVNDGLRLRIVSRFATRDVTDVCAPEELVARLEGRIGTVLGSAHLFTRNGLFQLEVNKQGEARLTRGRLPEGMDADAAPTLHDRSKRYLINPENAPWLRALDIVGGDGKVRASAVGKFRQINRFAELVTHLLPEDFAGANGGPLRVVDIGAGKGGLTFALWHVLVRERGLAVEIKGVELRPELAKSAEAAARAANCDGLSFVSGRGADLPKQSLDILVALHACDTATDEALALGINGGARLIVVAPCCHKQVRPQLSAPSGLEALARHGIFAERLSEMVTDTLRVLQMESRGYRTRAFEFVGGEHTAKNVMLAGVRGADATAEERARREYAAMKASFGVERQELEILLGQKT